MPSDFHIIQTFLSLSDIGYTLTNPVKVSYKAVMQVWNTAKVNEKTGDVTFEYNGQTYEITPDVIIATLKLPGCNGPPDSCNNETLF